MHTLKAQAMARPKTWKPEYANITKGACKLGATDQDLADMFKVSLRTINNWKTTEAAFMAALKVGKTNADDRVERSLYQRALGYTHDEDKIFNAYGEPLIVPTKKHYPPDTTAAIFWLKNRRPDQWREKQEGADGTGNEVSEALIAIAGKLNG